MERKTTKHSLGLLNPLYELGVVYSLYNLSPSCLCETALCSSNHLVGGDTLPRVQMQFWCTLESTERFLNALVPGAEPRSIKLESLGLKPRHQDYFKLPNLKFKSQWFKSSLSVLRPELSSPGITRELAKNTESHLYPDLLKQNRHFDKIYKMEIHGHLKL